jgi:16S rRNA (cytosine967-C5)-methyltransferase
MLDALPAAADDGPMSDNDPNGRRPSQRRTTRTGSGAGTLPRKLALEIILESDGGRRNFIDQGLEVRLADAGLSGKDGHLLQEIAYGAVRHRNTLDHLLEVYLPLPMKRQRPPVRWGLRVAAYQVVYLTRIPIHAAIDRTIEAVKELPEATRQDAGFLNAVLRKLAADILRKASAPPIDADDPTTIPIRSGFCSFRRPVLPLRNLDPVGHLALKYSHPKWMVARWSDWLDEDEVAAVCASGNRTPHVVARVTAGAPAVDAVLASLRIQGVEAEPLRGTRSLVLRRPGDPRKLEALQKGWIVIQDPTATEIGEALRPPAGARVLDLCAAPGGKAVQILEAVGPRGSVVACDIEDEKVARLEENLKRSGGRFEARKIPAEPEAIELGETFSHILLDAPCSNTGVLARRPEARWRFHAEDLPKLVELQKRLLAAAARHLAPGGRLVYATCSIEPEEDGGQAEWASLEIPGLRKVDERLLLPGRLKGPAGEAPAAEEAAAVAPAPAAEGEPVQEEPAPGEPAPTAEEPAPMGDGGYFAVLERETGSGEEREGKR